jgi:DNA polymerase-3 subunit alpha
MDRNFTHLHLHTEYSLLDGAARITKLMERASKLGMKNIAVTDHGVMYGAVEFYKQAKDHGIKPIIGCEVYIAERSRLDKDPVKDKNQYHLILLAENQQGYKNLMKIVSEGFINGFYYKPRVDKEVLRKYSEGLICLSACIAGEIPSQILDGNFERAKQTALEYKNIFGENNFFLELQEHGIEEQKLINEKLIDFGKDLDIPLVLTNDTHYINKEDAKFHDILLCIQTQKTVDEERMRFPSEEFYLKSYEEMMEIFPGMEEAAENTNKIAERCNVEFDFSTTHLPNFDVPEGYGKFEYLEKLCNEGLEDRYDNITAEIKERLEYELGVIKSMEYVDYFLIVWDFIRYAKEKDIMVGPGRGSAVGSLVAYALKITDIDPLRYSLIFERFLNPERISMPDIDIDFCYERREEVIDYVVEKYGSDKVAQIVTFGTMAARGAIRDVGRAMNFSYKEVDFIAKRIPMELGITIKKALEMNEKLRELYETDDDVKELIDISRKVEGLPRHTSTHAAGVVISKLPITEYVPLSRNKDVITTQYNMTELEELGLLKMDFLGLRTLTVTRDAKDLIEKNYDIEIDFDNMNFDDPEVYKMFAEGNTLGIFQFESTGMRAILKEMKPDNFENIVAANALYRPGPMSQIPTYIQNKSNPNNIAYLHPKLEKILNVTYGCMVYQEQVMQIVRDIGGFSMGRSDLVRRAMSKKKMKVMEEERQYFIHGKKDKFGNLEIRGAVRNGVDEKTANQIYDLMIDFAKYAFNKSHSAAYAALAYRSAWLKKYYPVEFMAAQISSIMGSSDSVSKYIRECRRLNIEVLPPDINYSEGKFIVKEGKIRYGMAAVKNVGSAAIEEIVKIRKEKGKFESFIDFCEKVPTTVLNKRQIESLIKAGAFDSTGAKRSQLMAIYEKTIDGISKQRKNNVDGQVSLFDSNSISEKFIPRDNLPKLKEFNEKVKLNLEKEMLGIYLSGHPLSEFEEVIEEMSNTNSSELMELSHEHSVEMDRRLYDGAKITLGGIIIKKQNKVTRNNNLMAFATLEDLYGSVELIIFPNTLDKYGEIVQEDSIVFVEGKLSYKEDENPKIICERIKSINKDLKKKIYLKIEKDKSLKEEKRKIIKLIKNYPGINEVYVYVEKDDKSYKLPKKYRGDGSNKLFEVELKDILGKDNVVIK